MTTQKLGNIVVTLITNSFNIKQIERLTPMDTIINTYKFDKLGAEIRYSILFTINSGSSTSSKQLSTIAKTYNSKPLIVSDFQKSDFITSYTEKDFFNFFGGIVSYGLVLIPTLTDFLDRLGHNELPIGLTGKPDDLHELYVSECLQFILDSPVRRYGIDRVFESLPDGVVLAKDRFMILFDSKAYSKGFEFQADDIKRFTAYIEDFNQRYSNFLGRIFSFLVISGNFNDSKKSLTNRSQELYKSCNCKLSCIESKTLGSIVDLLRKEPELRNSINWKTIFLEEKIEQSHIEKEITRIRNDKII